MQMKTKKLISIGKTLAIAIIILGVIHDAATYSPLIKGGLSCVDLIGQIFEQGPHLYNCCESH